MENKELNNPQDPATKSQLWALFCATKRDHRNDNLTKQQAFEILQKLNEGKPKLEKKAKDIFEEAVKNGELKITECVPVPMTVIERQNPLDDSSKIVKQWHVEDGLCGFASINISYKSEINRQFINQLKKAKLAGNDHGFAFGKDDYYKGYTYWVHQGNQSIAKKTAFAHGFAEVLNKYGIDYHIKTQLD